MSLTPAPFSARVLVVPRLPCCDTACDDSVSCTGTHISQKGACAVNTCLCAAVCPHNRMACWGHASDAAKLNDGLLLFVQQTV